MKLLFKDKEEFENFCGDRSRACPSDLGLDALPIGECHVDDITCRRCWEQSEAEIIFEDAEEDVTDKFIDDLNLILKENFDYVALRKVLQIADRLIEKGWKFRLEEKEVKECTDC